MSKAPSAIIIRIIPTTHNILVVVVVVMKPQGPVQLPFSSFLSYFLLQSPLFTIERKPALSFGIALVSMVLWFLFGGWCFGHIAFLFCLEEEAPLITCGGGGFLFCMLMVDGGTRTQIDIEILKHTHTHFTTCKLIALNCVLCVSVCQLDARVLLGHRGGRHNDLWPTGREQLVLQNQINRKVYRWLRERRDN